MNSVGRSWLLLTGFVVFYVIYLLFGALVFSSTERPMEDRLRRDMEVLRQEFLNHSCISAASLEHFLAKVLAANKFGVSVFSNSSEPSNWDLASSMFFANTLVTTVGEFGANKGKFGEETNSLFYTNFKAKRITATTYHVRKAAFISCGAT